MSIILRAEQWDFGTLPWCMMLGGNFLLECPSSSLLRADAAVMLPDHQKHSAKDIEQTASRFASARAKYEAAKAGSAAPEKAEGEQSSADSQSPPTEGSSQRVPEPMRPAAAFEGGEQLTGTFTILHGCTSLARTVIA